MNLRKGLYGTIRNPLAHDPKVEWDMTEQGALDILTTISFGASEVGPCVSVLHLTPSSNPNQVR